MDNTQEPVTVSKLDPNLQMTIRAIVRGSYDLQKMRIQLGNRIVATFRAKMGLTNSPSFLDAEEDKQAKSLMADIKVSYSRVTDGLIDLSTKRSSYRKDILAAKNITYDGTITNYAELTLVNQYLSLLEEETRQFGSLERTLKDVEIYKQFLSKIPGLGTQLSSILISEINIHQANYPSSLHAYAGLDSITVGYYVDDQGKETVIHPRDVAEFYNATNDPEEAMYCNGYLVKFRSEGRSKKAQSLVKREYVARDGTIKTKDSITFNPFLKTKLLGVMANSMLKQSRTLVNGVAMGIERRKEYAKGLGMKEGSSDMAKVDAFLEAMGKKVEFNAVGYAEVYYNYKHRIQNDPRHSSKKPLHIHNMALRYLAKQFLIDLYKAWRTLEGLPVAPSYAEGKLGLTHGVVNIEKENFYKNRGL